MTLVGFIMYTFLGDRPNVKVYLLGIDCLSCYLAASQLADKVVRTKASSVLHVANAPMDALDLC